MAWHKTNKKWSADYAERILASMKNHIFPAIGHLPVTMLKTQHFTALLKVIEDKGFLEVASRTRQQLCNIMRYAVQQGLTENNPALHLEGVTARQLRITIPPSRWSGCPACYQVCAGKGIAILNNSGASFRP